MATTHELIKLFDLKNEVVSVVHNQLVRILNDNKKTLPKETQVWIMNHLEEAIRVFDLEDEVKEYVTDWVYRLANAHSFRFAGYNRTGCVHFCPKLNVPHIPHAWRDARDGTMSFCLGREGKTGLGYLYIVVTNGQPSASEGTIVNVEGYWFLY